MSCQDILAMRKLITQKYDEHEQHLNPYCNLLFCDNWQWPSSPISQNYPIKTKNSVSKTSLKAEITSWFLSLGAKQKCAFTLIKNPKFIQPFLQAYQKWNPNLLYHIFQKRSIPNYLNNNPQLGNFKTVMKHLRIAWLDEPVLYFQVQEEQSQELFLQFISWADQVSGQKLLEYAHKIKNKSDPEENLLWFSEQSFQELPAWLVNQFQKIIIKNFFDRSNFDADIYQKIKCLEQGSQKKSLNQCMNSGNKKQLQKLLCMKIEDALLFSKQDFNGFQAKLKVFEDQYYEEVALLMDYENSGIGTQQERNKKKKRKNKKKKNKNKDKMSEMISEKNEEVDEEAEFKETEHLLRSQANIPAQLIVDDQAQKLPNCEETIKAETVLQKRNQSVQEQEIIEKQETRESKQVLKQIQEDSNCEQVNFDKMSIYEQLESTQSVCSSLGFSKITNKSGKSHPGFECKTSESLHIEQKRSLSQKTDSFQDSQHSKRSNKSQKSSLRKQNKKYTYSRDIELEQEIQEFRKQSIASQRVDSLQESLHKNSSFLEESNMCSSEYIGEFQNQEQQTNKAKENIDTNIPASNKKRKRKNKGYNLLKDLSSKISNGFLTRQLNNFVDSLSTETNNLYDHKIVSFQRVRCFIQSIFPMTQALLFGSNAVGLSLPTSDIDIMLFNLPCRTREEATEVLAHLAVQIHTMGWVVSCSAYLNAKVPLIKLQIDPSINYLVTKRRCDYMMGPTIDPRLLSYLELKPNKKDNSKNTLNSQHQSTNNGYAQTKQANSKLYGSQSQQYIQNNRIIKVDISINLNDQGNLGAQSTQLMKSWMNMYPKIHRAILALKYVLAQRGFSSNFRGGIGSYCLFIMVAAFITEFPEMQEVDDGQFFMAILKFYGEDFENHTKSVTLIHPYPQAQQSINKQEQTSKSTCFISLEETYTRISSQYPTSNYSQEDILQYLNTFRDNPLRIFDPINNRIMSGSCQLYPQIKSQFRRIYKQLRQVQELVQKEVEMSVNRSEVGKMLENKKSVDKWLNKYEARSGFRIKKVFDGEC